MWRSKYRSRDNHISLRRCTEVWTAPNHIALAGRELRVSAERNPFSRFGKETRRNNEILFASSLEGYDREALLLHQVLP